MKHLKIKALAAFIILMAVLALFWAGGIIIKGSASDTLLQGEIIDYVIIPGCAVNGRMPGKCLQTRIDTAVEYLRSHTLSMAVCSGGQGSDEEASEAQIICEELIRRGIPENRILLEDKSTSTYENLTFTKQLLDERKGDTPYKVLIVTSDFHVYRTRNLARHAGFDYAALLSAKSDAISFYLGFFRELAIYVAPWIKIK